MDVNEKTTARGAMEKAGTQNVRQTVGSFSGCMYLVWGWGRARGVRSRYASCACAGAHRPAAHEVHGGREQHGERHDEEHEDQQDVIATDTAVAVVRGGRERRERGLERRDPRKGK